MLNYTHRVVHSGEKVAEVNQCSKKMVNEVEKEYLIVFSEPLYPIWEQNSHFRYL